jgi:hypothetical protein
MATTTLTRSSTRSPSASGKGHAPSAAKRPHASALASGDETECRGGHVAIQPSAAPAPLARRMRSRVSGPTGDRDHVGPRQIPARGVAETASRRSRLRSPPSQRKIVRERLAGRSPTGSGCGRYSAPCTHAEESEPFSSSDFAGSEGCVSRWRTALTITVSGHGQIAETGLPVVGMLPWAVPVSTLACPGPATGMAPAVSAGSSAR